MANSFLTNCGFTPTAGGTTDWTYSSGVVGYQNPTNAGAANGITYAVRAQSSDLSQWEYSVGTYNSGTGTFSRTTVLYNSSGTGTKQSGAGTKINFTNPPSLVAVVAMAEDVTRNYTQEPCGRLTATTGVPITSADVAAVTTVYYTPNAGRGGGNIITLWDGAVWIPIVFAETSLSLAGLTANTNYDVWGRINSGVLALDVTAWTNDTTRATAIAQQDGIDVKTGDATRRLLGTVRITGTVGQTEDSHTKRFISNRYNEQPRSMYATDPAGSWAYSVATTRQANANTANQLDYVVCVARPIWAHVHSLVVNNTGVNNANVGIGIDSASGNSAQLVMIANLSGTTYVPTTATYTGTPGVGRHYVVWEEFGGGSNTQTWLAMAANNISGIIGEVAN